MISTCVHVTLKVTHTKRGRRSQATVMSGEGLNHLKTVFQPIEGMLRSKLDCFVKFRFNHKGVFNYQIVPLEL